MLRWIHVINDILFFISFWYFLPFISFYDWFQDQILLKFFCDLCKKIFSKGVVRFFVNFEFYNDLNGNGIMAIVSEYDLETFSIVTARLWFPS